MESKPEATPTPETTGEERSPEQGASGNERREKARIKFKSYQDASIGARDAAARESLTLNL
jgi:hypothetical protein